MRTFEWKLPEAPDLCGARSIKVVARTEKSPAKRKQKFFFLSTFRSFGRGENFNVNRQQYFFKYGICLSSERNPEVMLVAHIASQSMLD